ncbi:hypothetical protein HJFPF1_02714 [Paramyrothecium foliicola]|nr:hypothetical protein HJFPF1_02714 [Paramyrothecium foliicola]
MALGFPWLAEPSAQFLSVRPRSSNSNNATAMHRRDQMEVSDQSHGLGRSAFPRSSMHEFQHLVFLASSLHLDPLRYTVLVCYHVLAFWSSLTPDTKIVQPV